MAESKQPPTMVEGATTGDVEDEIPAAKSGEDRKAAAALASLDASGAGDESKANKNIDVKAVSDAVNKAMKNLAGPASKAAGGASSAKSSKGPAVEVKKVKVDPADVALLVCVCVCVWRG